MPDLPSEVWLLVFENLDKPAHLLNVVLTCKLFYDLAIRSLLRHLHWDIANESSPIPLWLQNDEKVGSNVPYSLTVKEHYSLSNNSNFSSRQWGKYATVANRVASFTNLHTLTFDHTCVPNPLFSAIPKLPNLRHLCLKNVFFSFASERFGHFSTHLTDSFFTPEVDLKGSPSITELTLWCCMRDSHRVSSGQYLQMLRAFIGPHLRILRIDWSSTTAKYLAKDLELSIEVELPTQLEILEIKLPKVKAWSEGSSLWTLLDPLKIFLHSCKRLQQFSVSGHLPTLNLDRGTLPELSSYSGPMGAALSLLDASGGHAKQVEITDADESIANMTLFMYNLAQTAPLITSLDIQLLEWDIEILHAVVQLFPLLVHLSIKYKQGYPDEDTLVAFGPQFLSRLVNIQTVHIYNTLEPLPSTKRGPLRHSSLWLDFDLDMSYDFGHKTYKSPAPSLDYQRKLGPCAGPDEDVVDILIPWKRYCTNLVEVRFVRDWAWRRAGDGDWWCKRKLDLAISNNID